MMSISLHSVLFPTGLIRWNFNGLTGHIVLLQCQRVMWRSKTGVSRGSIKIQNSNDICMRNGCRSSKHEEQCTVWKNVAHNVNLLKSQSSQSVTSLFHQNIFMRILNYCIILLNTHTHTVFCNNPSNHKDQVTKICNWHQCSDTVNFLGDKS